MNKTVVLINPTAGGGKAAKQWPELRKKCVFLEPLEVISTQHAGHMTELARHVIKQGGTHILVIGGDGSLAEALNGFFENDQLINPDAVLGTIPMGSGSDFLKTFGLKDTDTIIERLKKKETTLCDVGHVTYQHNDGQTRKKYFMNISSFGCSGEIVNRVNSSRKPFGTKFAYMSSTIAIFLSYTNPRVHLEIDEGQYRDMTINNLFICNGKFSGGGMHWGPPRFGNGRTL